MSSGNANPSRPRSRSMTDLASAPAGMSASLARATGLFDHMQRIAADEQRRQEAFANSLPKLTHRDLEQLGQADSPCPICLNPLLTILDEEETALALDSPAHPIEELGVTRLVESCGHVFCRKDIRNWMREGQTTCPTCRRPFLHLSSPSHSRSPSPAPDSTEPFDVSDRLRQLRMPSASTLRDIFSALERIPPPTDEAETWADTYTGMFA
ncbi:uncharacterized protein LAESUDRAFT_720020 [Laetiporus sulphureus 93-53]|uniref:RING-type domain-containing protein n=1 Tax=Laetiporus sulphureus 93-53 TaxID=1314785 RepID=A0A165HQE8_9APHY|nr:uncharacterized protein LAESUDRAFT_720020 [Laetiporus sulphureus 93-53]KZT12050.1 hypothetical protein LAESUDRAFT_720020 [Laetiporus sulphureus 93-53]